MISRSLPVCIDHMKMSKLSCAPAQTISPLGSSAKQDSWTGCGVTNVRKLRYRTRSKARTVPSSDDDTTARPLCANATPVTAAEKMVQIKETREGKKKIYQVSAPKRHAVIRRTRLWFARSQRPKIPTAVLFERHVAKSRRCVPQLDLCVVSTRGDDVAARCVGKHVHVEKVPLLLEHVRLRLPFPNQQLPQLGTAKRQPFATAVDAHRCYPFLRNAKCVNVCKVRQLVQSKHAASKPDNKDRAGNVKRCAHHLCVVLEKVVFVFFCQVPLWHGGCLGHLHSNRLCFPILVPSVTAVAAVTFLIAAAISGLCLALACDKLSFSFDDGSIDSVVMPV
eukprot:m.198051 g.198051  ORF g.198051 m.198051 type:complete len:336 (-) comp18362_c0_seq5:700-1707(-)